MILGRSVVAVASAYALSSALTAFVALAIGRRAAGRGRPRFSATLLVLRASAPFAAAGMLWQLFFRVDVVLLRLFGVAEVSLGMYAAAYRVVDASRAPTSVIASALAPAVSAVGRRRESGPLLGLASGSLTLAVACASVATAALLFVPDLIVRVVFGHDYVPGAYLLRIMAPMPLLMALDSITIITLYAVDIKRAVIAVFTGALAINVIGNTAGIPYFGTAAAAWMTVISEAFVAAAFWIVLFRRVGMLGLRVPPLDARVALGALGLQKRKVP
jgi:O-antigen/teichoic acid export membrane protein